MTPGEPFDTLLELTCPISCCDAEGVTGKLYNIGTTSALFRNSISYQDPDCLGIRGGYAEPMLGIGFRGEAI